VEEDLLNRIAVERLLVTLPAEPRLVLELVFGLTYPADWPWPDTTWPPTFAAIGWYVGHKTRGKPLSEATIRYIRTSALRRLKLIAA
jgi:hypothetical protein